MNVPVAPNMLIPARQQTVETVGALIDVTPSGMAGTGVQGENFPVAEPSSEAYPMPETSFFTTDSISCVTPKGAGRNPGHVELFVLIFHSFKAGIANTISSFK